MISFKSRHTSNILFRVKNVKHNIIKKYVHNFENIPGPLSLPGIGTLYQYFPIIGKYRFDELQHNGLKKYNAYGPLVREEIVPGVNIIWLFDPNDFETLFRNEGKFPLRRSHLALEKFRLDRPFVYNSGGLLPTNGAEWHRIRRNFQKGLTSTQAVKKFISGSNDIIQEWLINVDNMRNSNIDFLPELSRLFLELTGQTTLNVRFNSFSKPEQSKNSRASRIINCAYATNSCILKTDNGPQLWRKFDTPLYRKLKRSQEYMETVAIDLISLKMSLFAEGKTNPSLLDLYLSCSEVDFKDIIGVVCDFLLAGIDTSTYTTSFLLYHLANNSSVQDRIYEECKRLLPDDESDITEEILDEAKYIKAVLKESLRLRPVSVGIGRVLQADTQFSGYTIPAGTTMVTQNQISCRLEKYFPYPDKFVPERWIKTHSFYKKPHPFLSLPFGHGPRSCIARRLAEQNMHILILKLFRNYRLKWNGGKLDSKSLLINKPDGPVLLEFIRR